MKLVRVALGVAAIALGASALVLAHDIRAWHAGVERGDARYAERPARARWHASTWLPADTTVRLLALADDLQLRRAEQAFVAAHPGPVGNGLQVEFDNGRRRSQLRGVAELVLSDFVSNGTPAQASRAGNLIGILAGSAPDEDVAGSEQRAAEAFDAAIRADGANVDAKYNLELLLRRIRVVGSREGAGSSGSGDLGDALAGAGSGRPGSGY